MSWYHDVVWGAPQWASVAWIVSGCLTVLVLWSYLGPGRGDAWSMGVTARVLAALLKLSAIAMLAVCLVQPMRRGTRPKPQANLMAIVVDNSASMALKSAPGQKSRGDKVRSLVDPEASWRVRLAQDFDVRGFALATRLENSDQLHHLPMDGRASSLAGGLRQLASRLQGRPVAGVLLFTDGNLTDGDSDDDGVELDGSRLGFPVYPVLPRDHDEVVDLRVADVSVTQSDFETAPVTVRVAVAATGMPPQDVVVQFSDMETGAVVEEQTIELTPGGGGDGGVPEVDDAVAMFRFRPLRNEVRFYRAAVFRPQDRQGWETGEAEGEVTYRNNSRLVTVDASGGPYRVLYIAGRPNWEFKFLRRALQEDAETDLVGVIRIADKEAKFTFRDRDVSSANPLFAGLDDTDDETAQRYDEAVLIRLGVRDADEFSRGFPRSAEELFPLHGVILHDIEAEFFTQDQLLLLRRFVALRGGGLMLLGGRDSLRGRRFEQSPLGELAPVYPPGQADDRGASGGGYRLQLTREGLLHPWVRLRDSEQAETDRIAALPAFRSLSPVSRAKPGASVLAIARNRDGQESPAIVAGRFGQGRVVAVPMGDLWRWSMRRGVSSGRPGSAAEDDSDRRDDPAQAWRQITRWLVNEAPRRVECRIMTSDDPSRPAQLVTRLVDEAFQSIENAKVKLRITPPEGDPFTLAAEADFDRPGQYLASHWARQAGGYRVHAVATAEDGSPIGEDHAGWTADPAAAEFQSLGINRRWLQQLADASGGELIDENRLDSFVTSMPSRKVPVTQAWVYPIWHRPWVMLVAILCLCGEWGLRRWKGMA